LILTIVSSVLAIFLIILGVQAFLVLREAQKTLKHINDVVEVAQHTAVRALMPLQCMGDVVTGMKSGLKVFETFVHYLKRVGDEE
jgi:hypothetical protein